MAQAPESPLAPLLKYSGQQPGLLCSSAVFTGHDKGSLSFLSLLPPLTPGTGVGKRISRWRPPSPSLSLSFLFQVA